MFNQFNKTYRKNWRISFEDVISLTKEINFKVNGTIPILLNINDLYLDDFHLYWGKGFANLARVALDNKLNAQGNFEFPTKFFSSHFHKKKVCGHPQEIYFRHKVVRLKKKLYFLTFYGASSPIVAQNRIISECILKTRLR